MQIFSRYSWLRSKRIVYTCTCIMEGSKGGWMWARNIYQYSQAWALKLTPTNTCWPIFIGTSCSCQSNSTFVRRLYYCPRCNVEVEVTSTSTSSELIRCSYQSNSEIHAYSDKADMNDETYLRKPHFSLQYLDNVGFL